MILELETLVQFHRFIRPMENLQKELVCDLNMAIMVALISEMMISIFVQIHCLIADQIVC